MLKDYFSFEINKDGQIISLPLLLEGYTPNMDKLPVFLLRLATEVIKIKIITYGQMDGWTDRWMDGCTDAWTDGWMHGWVDRWMNG